MELNLVTNPKDIYVSEKTHQQSQISLFSLSLLPFVKIKVFRKVDPVQKDFFQHQLFLNFA